MLAEREQRFVTLRDENLRLEACREVLTFRVHELENEREPLQLELMDLKQELDGAAEEVLGEGKARKQADLHAKEVRARERMAAKLLLKAEKRALDAASFLQTSLAELAQLCSPAALTLALTLALALALALALTLTLTLTLALALTLTLTLTRCSPAAGAERSWERVWRYLEQRGELAAQLGHGRGGSPPPAPSSDGEVLAELTRQRDRMQSTVLRLSLSLTLALTLTLTLSLSLYLSLSLTLGAPPAGRP